MRVLKSEYDHSLSMHVYLIYIHIYINIFIYFFIYLFVYFLIFYTR